MLAAGRPTRIPNGSMYGDDGRPTRGDFRVAQRVARNRGIPPAVARSASGQPRPSRPTSSARYAEDPTAVATVTKVERRGARRPLAPDGG